MNEVSQLIYPSFTLFLYDLREDLGQDRQKIRRNSHRFWRKLEPALDGDYDRLDEKQQQLLDKLSAREKPDASAMELFSESPQGKKPLPPPARGHAYALQLGDTYALQINYAGSTQEESDVLSPQPLHRLSELQKGLLSLLNRQGVPQDLNPEKQGSIGQTWLLWAKLPGNHPESSQVAAACRQQLVPQGRWEKTNPRQGRFAGATVYELWQAPVDWSQPGLENQHLLVFLFPPRQQVEEAQATMERLYPHLLRLLAYRHKILWAYAGSRTSKQSLKADYIEIEEMANALTLQLSDRTIALNVLRTKLSETLALASRYMRHLSDLERQARTIQSNAATYSKELQKIYELNPDCQLGMLAEFVEGAAEGYRLQIEADRTRFSVGSALLDNILKVLGGAISVRQAQPDLTLQSTLIAVGVGVATSQTISVAFWGGDRFSASPVTVVLAVFVSLLLGGLAGAIVWKLYRFR